MWIRSQDKKTLQYCENIFKDIDFKNNICISARTKNGTYSFLGYYSSEEKALKVLDMIQEKILCPQYINDIGGNEMAIYKNKVFQMPQNNEVES